MKLLCQAQTFIQGNAGGSGKVQGAGIRCDGNVEGGIGVFVQDFFRKSFGFRSENEKQPDRRRHGPEGGSPFFGKHRNLVFFRRHFQFKRVKVFPERQFDPIPVIQTGPLHLTAVKGKAQGLNNMQIATCGQAGASDIACIPMYFRGHQNDVPLYLVVIAMKMIFAQLWCKHID